MSPPNEHPSDYSFLRAGLGGSAATPDAVDVAETPAGKVMLSLVMLVMQHSTESAATYCAHANRTAVHPKDVLYGLMYEAMTFFKRPDLEQDAEAWQRELFNEEQQTDDTEPESDEAASLSSRSGSRSSLDDAIIGPDEGWTPSTCTCDLCEGVNKAVATWDDHVPTDPAEKFLKSAVERTMAQTRHLMTVPENEDI